MNKVKAIETEIEQLSPKELTAFRKWFLEFDNEEWDRQIEDDARSGKLDALVAESLEAHRRGESREI